MMEMKEDIIYQCRDAQRDMLKGLNTLTDCACPTFQQVQMMYMLSKGVKYMQTTINMEYELHGEAAEMADHDHMKK